MIVGKENKPQASPAVSGGGGVSFGGIASGFTPGYIQYIDTGGNQYGDSLAMRDSITNQTFIGASFGAGLTSGFSLNTNIFGFGIDGASLIQLAPDGFGGMVAGDFTNVGLSDCTVGIIAFSGLGSQAIFLFDPIGEVIQMNINDNVNNQSSIQMLPTQLDIGWSNMGGTENAIQLDALGIHISHNNNQIGTLPLADGTTGQVIWTDGVGNWSFGNAGGTPGGSAFDLQYNKTGPVFGGDGKLQWDYNNFILKVGDQTFANTFFGVDLQNQEVQAYTNDFIVKQLTSGNEMFHLETIGRVSRLGPVGWGNGTYYIGTDLAHRHDFFTNFVPVQTPISYIPIGAPALDDLSTTGTFLGPSGFTNYVITIDGTGTVGPHAGNLRVALTPTSGTISLGNAVTSYVGLVAQGTGFVTAIAGGFYYLTWAAGFNSGNTYIIDGSNQGTIDSNSTLVDTFSWIDNHGHSGANIPMIPPGDGGNILSYNIEIAFGNENGHTYADEWAFAFTITGGRMLALDGSAGTSKMGDVDSIGNGNFFLIDDSLANQFSVLTANNLIQFNSAVIQRNGGIVDSAVTTKAYGTTTNLLSTNGIHQIVFTGSTGATTVNLPTGTTAPIGTEYLFTDADKIQTTSNITFDAGTSNSIITVSTSGQTYVWDGSSSSTGIMLTLKKITSTLWVGY